MKGIQFNSKYGMWEAAILGTKTNTRRTGKTVGALNNDPDNWKLLVMDGHKFKMTNIKTGQIAAINPRYRQNDVCYLQEPTLNTEGILTKEKQVFYMDKDHNGNSDTQTYKPLIDQATQKGATWKNKRYMNQADARYHVLITEVRLERLQNISNEDCLKEGLHHKTSLGNKIFRIYEKGKYYKDPEAKYTRDAKASYASLFKIVNEPEPWDNNHWCLSYHFKLLTPKEVEEIRLQKVETIKT